jgi:hypothetical protein
VLIPGSSSEFFCGQLDVSLFKPSKLGEVVTSAELLAPVSWVETPRSMVPVSPTGHAPDIAAFAPEGDV